MIHLKPIPEAQASESIRAIYSDIKGILKTESVPLFFQYLANYEDLLNYIWSEAKKHIDTEKFHEATNATIKSSLKNVIEIYHPTEKITSYVASLDENTREEKTIQVFKMLQIQAKMLLIEIQIREAIKGMPVLSVEQHKELLSGKLDNEEKKDLAASVDSALTVPQEQEFDKLFEIVEHEMDQLVTSKPYLESRVQFEKNIQFSLLSGAFPFQISYATFRGYLANRPYNEEFMFLLKDVFPSNAPKQLYTAALMNYVLND